MQKVCPICQTAFSSHHNKFCSPSCSMKSWKLSQQRYIQKMKDECEEEFSGRYNFKTFYLLKKAKKLFSGNYDLNGFMAKLRKKRIVISKGMIRHVFYPSVEMAEKLENQIQKKKLLEKRKERAEQKKQLFHKIDKDKLSKREFAICKLYLGGNNFKDISKKTGGIISRQRIHQIFGESLTKAGLSGEYGMIMGR